MDLIHRFIFFVKEKEEVVKNGISKTVTKEKMIFPRYHQYDVVRKIMADVRQNGVGTNYLISTPQAPANPIPLRGLLIVLLYP